MARLIKLEATKTYATEQNAIRAVEKVFGNSNIRFFVVKTAEDRFYPVFVGQEAVSAGAHFHFSVVM